MRLSTDYLYKYRNFKNLDGSINTYTQNLLEYGEMFFAKPSQFEDVHDCEVKVFLAATNKAIRDFWKDELLQIDPNFENLLHRMGFWGNPQGFAKWYTKKFSKEKSTESENLSLYCLCNNSLQEAMWEKYATQEGVCIGFRTFCHMGSVGIKLKENIVYDDGKQKCKSTFIPFINVQYGKDNHAKVNRLPTSEFMENLKKALLTKDDYWSFESESRAFVYNSNLDRMSLGERGIKLHCDEHSIGEIMFSEHIKESTISYIHDIIENRIQGRDDVKFYRIGRDGKNELRRIICN